MMAQFLKGIIEGFFSGLLRFFESLRRDRQNQQLGELRTINEAKDAVLREKARQDAIDASNPSVALAVERLRKHKRRASGSNASISNRARTSDSTTSRDEGSRS